MSFLAVLTKRHRLSVRGFAWAIFGLMFLAVYVVVWLAGAATSWNGHLLRDGGIGLVVGGGLVGLVGRGIERGSAV